MTNKHIIIEQLLIEKINLSCKYDLQTLGLFGSYATDTATDESDIDIFYQNEEGKQLNFEQILNFEQDLVSILSKKIDLVNLKNINPIIHYTAKKTFIYV